MSTLIAIRTAAGAMQGRYLHDNGLPTLVGADLHAIVNAQGLADAVRVLTAEHFGWNYLNPSIEAGAPPFLGSQRAEIVPGFGEAYLNVTEHPDYWETPDEAPSSWTTWVYVLTEQGLEIRRPTVENLRDDETGRWALVATVTWELRGDLLTAALHRAEVAGYSDQFTPDPTPAAAAAA